MAIITIPDDDEVEKLANTRKKARKEPIIGEITQRTIDGRRINFIDGAILDNVDKLTIIGHGHFYGFLIGPYAKSNKSSATAEIRAPEMAGMLRKARFGGRSIDVMACFSWEFAKELSAILPGTFIKGYTDPIYIDSFDDAPSDGPKHLRGKAVIQPHKQGAPEGKKGKKYYLNGKEINKADYHLMSGNLKLGLD